MLEAQNETVVWSLFQCMRNFTCGYKKASKKLWEKFVILQSIGIIEKKVEYLQWKI